MDEKDRNKIAADCHRKCGCNKYKRSQSPPEGSESYNVEERTLLMFLRDIISVVAFIFFGSVIFWLAVGGVLLDFCTRLYYSHRYVKYFFAALFTILLLSISIRMSLNKRACRAQFLREQMEIEKKKTKDESLEPPVKAPVEYMRIDLKDKKAQNGDQIDKKFTLAITDEKKKEVFRTVKEFSIPSYLGELALEMKQPPALIVRVKEIILENY